MAAGLGFKTFTTGEVLTAADTNGYLMQGVLVFASAAARDAAITSPQEGQFAYLKDTNVTTYYTGSAWTNLDTTGMVNPMTTTGDTIYSSPGSTPARLGIGSTGQVLTVAGGVPSWATAATGALTLISTTSFSAVGTQSFNNVFSATYDNYLIMMKFYSSSNNPTFMRMRASGTDASGGNYNGAVRTLSSSAAMATEWAGSGSTSFTIGNLPTTASTTPMFLTMTMFNPYSTSNRKAQWHNFIDGDGSKGGYGWGQFTVNGTAYDGFTIYNSTGGATTLTGTVSIYGVAK